MIRKKTVMAQVIPPFHLPECIFNSHWGYISAIPLQVAEIAQLSKATYIFSLLFAVFHGCKYANKNAL